MMRQPYTLEIVFLLIVIAVSLVGFSSLVRGDLVAITGYHVLHIITSLAWLLLLLGQLVLIRQRRFDRHRVIGKYITIVGPILIASVSLLSVHSAAREAAAGTVDDLVVQNVTFTLELALLVCLAFVLRRNRNVHGSLLMGTALMFLVIALFFTFISYVPGYRIEGPETFDRFARSGQTSALIGSVIGLLFFLRNVRTGWPWILVSAFFLLNGYLQMVVDQSGRTQRLTVLVGSIGEAPAFGLGLTIFAGLLWAAWKAVPTQAAPTRRTLALVAVVAGGVGLAAQPPSKKPTIVVIFADDLGYGDLGAFGAPNIRTPRLDAMAAEGQKWTNFYVQPVCSPSRAALLTGRLPVRNGMFGTPGGTAPKVFRDNAAAGLPSEETTLAELLKSTGYRTGMIGKWHLGHLPEYLPLRQGFDSWFGVPYSHDMRMTVPRDQGTQTTAYYEPRPKYWDVALMRGDDVIERPVDHRTLTKRYTDEAVRFIRQRSPQPFFLYMAHSLPHIPLARSDAFVGHSAGGVYGDVVEELDWSVGQVLDALRAAKVERNTLVVFTSDNGPWLPFGTHGGSAGPLKEGKGTTWEGGVRTPAIFWWPGSIRPRTMAGIGSAMDVFATAAKLAGASLPEDRVLDTVDLTPALLRGQESPRDELIYYWDSELRAIRQGQYKAHFITSGAYGLGDPRTEHDTALLFDLAGDPGERVNIAADHPEVVSRLRRAADAHRRTVTEAPPLFDRLLAGPSAR